MKDETPKIQSLVLADQVYVDRNTGKKIIAGTFNQLWAKEFRPDLKFGRTTWAYACLTGLQGEHKVKLVYTDLQSDQALMQTSEMTVISKDPNAGLELILEVPPFPMPHPGVYVFEVMVDDNSIGALRVKVGKATQ